MHTHETLYTEPSNDAHALNFRNERHFIMANEPEVKTVAADMETRTFFKSTDDVAAYLQRCQQEFSDFGDQEFVWKGISFDAEGKINFDPEIFVEGCRILVQVVSERISVGVSKVKGIIIVPVPTLAAIAADETGQKWLERVVDKSLSDFAARVLRRKDMAADSAEVMANLPITLADYTTTSQASTLLDGFNRTWKIVKKVLADNFKVFALSNPSKGDLLNSMLSASYAQRLNPALENRTGGSLFEAAIQLFMRACKDAGYDYSIFEDAIKSRHTRVIDLSDGDDEGFDLGSLSSALSIAMTAPAENTDQSETQEIDQSTTETIS